MSIILLLGLSVFWDDVFSKVLLTFENPLFICKLVSQQQESHLRSKMENMFPNILLKKQKTQFGKHIMVH